MPRQHSTGGKDKLGSITKQGNRYGRDGWFVTGAMAVIRYAKKHGTRKAAVAGTTRWSADTPRWRRWRSPTRWRGWPGPSWSVARDTRSRSCCWQRENVSRSIGNTNWRGHDDVMQKRLVPGIGGAR